MTTLADWDRKDRIAARYGVQESGVPVGSEYHAAKDYDRKWTLSEVAKAGGTVTRVRLFHERGAFDISYIDATLPSGQVVSVNTAHCPESFLIRRSAFKGVLIEWAKAERVFAKGLGLLDEANWSILW